MDLVQPADPNTRSIELRQVSPDDLDTFFAHQQNADAVWMAAFTPVDPTDRETFEAQWHRMLGDDSISVWTIVDGTTVVGHIATFEMFGEREITYWIDDARWGRGIATEAVSLMLSLEPVRPLHGRTAFDNVASGRVLEKNGFRPVGTDRGFANARNAEIEETIWRLDA